MPESVKVLSLQQPHADMIFHGHKWAENRSWQTHYRGELFIHTSKVDRAAVREWQAQGVDLAAHIPMQVGVILGKVTLLDCVRSEDLHRFAPKQYRKTWLFGRVDSRAKVSEHLRAMRDFLKTVPKDSWRHVSWDEFTWILSEPRLLAQPVPSKGRLNLWSHDWDPRFAEFRDT